MASTNDRKSGEDEARDPEIEAVFETIEQLHERIAEVHPGLALRAEFGGAATHPELRDFTETFRDFDNGPRFVNAFAKAGDGFINIHSLEE